MKLVSLKEASESLGLSVMTLRRRIYAGGTIPYTRANATKLGKILIDIDAFQQILQGEANANLKAKQQGPQTAQQSHQTTQENPQSDSELFDVGSLIDLQRKAKVDESFTSYVSKCSQSAEEAVK